MKTTKLSHTAIRQDILVEHVRMSGMTQGELAQLEELLGKYVDERAMVSRKTKEAEPKREL